MVKLARIITSTSDGLPLLTAQVKSTEFQSAEIQAYLLKKNKDLGISESDIYINISSIATTASEFLSLGEAALAKAKILIEKATSSDVKLVDQFIENNVIFKEKVIRILSPLDGQKEVGKFLVSKTILYVKLL